MTQLSLKQRVFDLHFSDFCTSYLLTSSLRYMKPHSIRVYNNNNNNIIMNFFIIIIIITLYHCYILNSVLLLKSF